MHVLPSPIAGQIPVVALNYTILANYSPFDRDTVEMCVKEILHTFSYVVGVGKSIELPLVSVGKLVVRDGRAKMKFFRDFIQQLDSSGQLEDAFHQRSATAMSTVSMQSEASIISNRVGSVLSRPGTTGSVVLPKIVEPSFRNSLSLTCSSPNSGGGSGFLSTSPKMPPISEEEASGGGNQEHSSEKGESHTPPSHCSCSAQQHSPLLYSHSGGCKICTVMLLYTAYFVQIIACWQCAHFVSVCCWCTV